MFSLGYRKLAVSSFVVLFALVATACGPRVIISTGTTIGLKATPGDGYTRPPQVTLAYKRAETAFVPTKGDIATASDDAFSTLAALHFSTEWFSSIAKYAMMNTADKISQSNPSDTLRFHLTDNEKSVLNAGIGAEFFINKRISGFASFSTDFSSISDDLTRFIERKPETSDGTWSSDFYNVGGGFVLNLNGADITLGVTHTGANLALPRPINFPDNSQQPIFNMGDVANARWDRWRFVFSFSFPFLKNYAKKFTGEEEKK